MGSFAHRRTQPGPPRPTSQVTGLLTLVTGLVVAVTLAATLGAARRGISDSPTAPTTAEAVPTPAGGPRVLFGMGTEADTARHAELVQRAPVKMLTSWYNGPEDLSWMTGWRTGLVPSSYAAGFALHLVVWNNDPEGVLATSHGTACGRAYPLSDRFLDDMRRLAQTFAGPASGPPLYVTLFTEFQTYPCIDNAWRPDSATTVYYAALKDQYRAAYDVFHRHAPNARVSLGWGGWQASYDEPGKGGGRSMFAHFADVMVMSDFQSFQAMRSDGNIADIRAMVSTLGVYGPVMLAHYKPDNGSQATFEADIREIMTASFLSTVTTEGLFAVSFMDESNLLADRATFELVRNGVTEYGGGW